MLLPLLALCLQKVSEPAEVSERPKVAIYPLRYFCAGSIVMNCEAADRLIELAEFDVASITGF